MQNYTVCKDRAGAFTSPPFQFSAAEVAIQTVHSSGSGDLSVEARLNKDSTWFEVGTITGDTITRMQAYPEMRFIIPASNTFSITARELLFSSVPVVTWSSIVGVPAEFPPEAHTHPATEIGAGSVSDTEFGYLDGVTSAIQTQLNAKAASSHTHAQSDITSLVSDLAGKAASSHVHAGADITSGTVAEARLPSTFTSQKVFETGATGTAPVVFRQTGGVAGTDELQIGHSGTLAYIESKDGNIRIRPAGTASSAALDVKNDAGGDVFIAGFARTLYFNGRFSANGSTAGWDVDSSNVNLKPSNSTYQIAWNADVGVTRSAAGVLRVTNGSSGGGELRTSTLRVDTSTTAPSTGAYSAVAGTYIGANENTHLMTPNAWMPISLNGVSYKIPLY